MGNQRISQNKNSSKNIKMASNRPTGFGLSRELAEKNAAKYSQDDEVEIVEWVCAVTGVAAPAESGPAGFQVFLKDGQVLCQLANTLKPGICRKPHDTSKTKIAALRQNKENENISFFLKACEDYGLNKTDLFQTVDLVAKLSVRVSMSHKRQRMCLNPPTQKTSVFYYTSTCLYCTFFKFFTTQQNQTVKPKTRTHVMFYYVIMTP